MIGSLNCSPACHSPSRKNCALTSAKISGRFKRENLGKMTVDETAKINKRMKLSTVFCVEITVTNVHISKEEPR